MADYRGKHWSEMAEKGLSYSEIAKTEGVSRGQVAGAVGRFRQNPGCQTRAPSSPRPPTDPKTLDPEFRPSITLPDYEAVVAQDTCRFITGDRRAGMAIYCGHERATGSDYCIDHHRICYRAPTNIKSVVENEKSDTLDDRINIIRGGHAHG